MANSSDIFYRTVEHPLRVGSPESLATTRFRGYLLWTGTLSFTMKSAALQSTSESPPRKQKTASGREFHLPRVDQRIWLLLENDEALTITSSIEESEGRLAIPEGRDIRFVVTAKKSQTEPRPR